MQNRNGLYDPSMEHDACGIGFLANLHAKRTHKLVEDSLIMLRNMEHRGGCGCEPETGDGAGILIQIPHEFFEKECANIGIKLPEQGKYGVGVLFFPKDETIREECRTILNINLKKSGFKLLGYRKVPVNNEGVGKTALSLEPRIEQIFVTHEEYCDDPETFERKLYVLRRHTTHTIGRNVNDTMGFSIFQHFPVILLPTKDSLQPINWNPILQI